MPPIMESRRKKTAHTQRARRFRITNDLAARSVRSTARPAFFTAFSPAFAAADALSALRSARLAAAYCFLNAPLLLPMGEGIGRGLRIIPRGVRGGAVKTALRFDSHPPLFQFSRPRGMLREPSARFGGFLQTVGALHAHVVLFVLLDFPVGGFQKRGDSSVPQQRSAARNGGLFRNVRFSLSAFAALFFRVLRLFLCVLRGRFRFGRVFPFAFRAFFRGDFFRCASVWRGGVGRVGRLIRVRRIRFGDWQRVDAVRCWRNRPSARNFRRQTRPASRDALPDERPARFGGFLQRLSAFL